MQNQFDFKFWIFLVLNVLGNTLVTLFIIGEGVSTGVIFLFAYLLWQITNIVISIISINKGHNSNDLRLYLKICMYVQAIICFLMMGLIVAICFICNNEYCVIIYISAIGAAIVDLMIGLGGLFMMLDAYGKDKMEFMMMRSYNNAL